MKCDNNTKIGRVCRKGVKSSLKNVFGNIKKKFSYRFL